MKDKYINSEEIESIFNNITKKGSGIYFPSPLRDDPD